MLNKAKKLISKTLPRKNKTVPITGTYLWRLISYVYDFSPQKTFDFTFPKFRPQIQKNKIWTRELIYRWGGMTPSLGPLKDIIDSWLRKEQFYPGRCGSVD